MSDRHLKYKPGALVLVRKLGTDGKVIGIWGGRVLASNPKEMTLLAVEMVYRDDKWHALGDFQTLKAPPHRLPYQWDFPRLLVENEASDIDLPARPVLQTALELYQQQKSTKD